MAQCEGLQCADFAFHLLRALAITLVDHEDVGDLHDAGLDGLDVVAHAGNENHNRDVGEADDIDFILPDADGFDQDRGRGREASSTVVTSAVVRASPPRDPRVAMLRM